MEALSQKMCSQKQEEKEEGSHSREWKTEVHHDSGYAQDREYVPCRCYDTRRDKFVDILHVACHIVEGFPVRGLVEIGDGEPQYVAEDGETHVLHNILAKELGRIDLDIDGPILEENEEKVEEGHQ